ncbi:MAG: PilW family protein [Gammaproteobacteria bacterium]|nr:PilW family protein [Gammaproteobacteria bacterium]
MIQRQRGFTLLEMALASLLTTFIVLIVVQAYQANQQSYQYQTAITRIQADARFVSTLMIKHLSLAGTGAGDVSGTTDLINFPTVSDTVTTTNDYSGGDPVSTCNGTGTGLATGTSAFSIDATTSSLTCDSSIGGAGNQTLLENVEHMRVLYGVNTQLDGVAGETLDSESIDRWVDASVVPTLAVGWDGVRAIQVGFILRSENAIGLDTSLRSYTLLDRTVVKNDGRLRYVFSFTVALRNRI